ncbi:MAG: ABC transporter ATP-binding protein [Alphaproteobacteria bacterium]|nr:ABC transporter ATP-binding protein [Alphaproteobacteria bacterium]
MAALLEVEDLHVRLPVAGGTLHAVRGIGFALQPGRTLCLVGESGCGKSLTALALMALLPRRAARDAARLSFAGTDLRSLPERRMAALRGDRMAMIFQDPMTSLNPTMRVGTQLVEALRRHRRVSAAAARDRAVALLERVGIAGAAARLGQYPHQFSGGQRQRLMLAMALMCEPQLLVADEPTTALDVTIQAQILRLLAEVQRELGLALLLITHDLGIVARMADEVAVMYAGEIVERGPAAAVFAAPQHPYTQGLLNCIPAPGRTLPGTPLAAIAGVVPSLVGDWRGCAFRARCSRARPACADDPVPTRTAAGRHSYRCVLSPAPAGREAAP